MHDDICSMEDLLQMANAKRAGGPRASGPVERHPKTLYWSQAIDLKFGSETGAKQEDPSCGGLDAVLGINDLGPP